jgi:hypothetical protein
MKRNSKTSLKRIQELLGAPEGEFIPINLTDARMMQESIGGEPIKRQESDYPKCEETGKTCYPSKSRANEAMRSRLKKGANTGKLRCYKCPDCRHYHMSSSFH